MLADGVEAAVRASPGVDGDQIRAIIHRLAQERLQDGQFDECNLTLRDLAMIEESFATVLQGLSHPPRAVPGPAARRGRGNDHDRRRTGAAGIRTMPRSATRGDCSMAGSQADPEWEALAERALPRRSAAWLRRASHRHAAR